MPAAARFRPAALAIVLVFGMLGAALPGCASRPAVEDRAWLVTVYYTAVESFHRDQPVRITGCRARACQHGTDELGWYPGGFAAAVRDEGTGRITSGQHAGRYLNWSHDVGYWLDDAPQDARTAGRWSRFAAPPPTACRTAPAWSC